MLGAYHQYFLSVIHLLLKHDSEETIEKRKIVERVFRKLPDWFYDIRFDIAIHVGRRYFIIKLDQLGEVLFSIHHLARSSFEDDFLEKMTAPILGCANKVSLFFAALITVLERKELKEGVDDFSEEIEQLEKNFHEILLSKNEFLDTSKDYVYFAEFICELKELRAILLRLAEALRTGS